MKKIFGKNKTQEKPKEPPPIYALTLLLDPRDGILRAGTVGTPIPLDIAHKMLDSFREQLVMAQVQQQQKPPADTQGISQEFPKE